MPGVRVRKIGEVWQPAEVVVMEGDYGGGWQPQLRRANPFRNYSMPLCLQSAKHVTTDEELRNGNFEWERDEEKL